MHPSLNHLGHRPWPLPSKPWPWRQKWLDLLFAHWQVKATDLAHLVPKPLELEVENGMAWVGVVPFRMAGVAPRYIPFLPWLSAFPEINLRLYVRYQDKPGVWFLSLDAGNPVAVWAARKFFHLPYFNAHFSLRSQKGGFHFESQRRNASKAAFKGIYEPTSAVALSKPGSVEHLLTERYCLYAVDSQGRLYRTQVHHAPWPLQEAKLELEILNLSTWLGFNLEGPPVLTHFAKGVDVIAWNPERL